jgi:hypothetical protein
MRVELVKSAHLLQLNGAVRLPQYAIPASLDMSLRNVYA